MYNKYVFSSDLSPKEITQIITENGKTSNQREKMLEALAYYSGNNLEIMKKERVYYDKDHNKHENESASNVRNKSGFLRMLVQQKQDYALAKTFIFKLSTDNVDDVNIKEDDYGRAWRDFLDRTFHETVYRLIGDSVNLEA
jgi:hypothetical protein